MWEGLVGFMRGRLLLQSAIFVGVRISLRFLVGMERESG
jgi:hypothetical protein